MFHKRFTAGAAALACAGSLGLSAGGLTTAAGATTVPPGARPIQQFFPVAERLCTSVADGRGSARLHRNATLVLADCAALQGGFASAHTLFVQAESLNAKITSESLAANARCASSASTPVHATCVRARTAAAALLESLRAQRASLNGTARADITTSRGAFWAGIRALPGAPASVPAVKHVKRTHVKHAH